jgi:aminopeptidase N
MLNYYKQWAFKHPTPDDFIKVAEQTSGIQLQWYKNYMLHTAKTIDYAIDSLWEENGESKIRLKKLGDMPIPIDLQLTFRDSTSALHYIPLNMMYGAKQTENEKQPFVVHEPWNWLQPYYTVTFKEHLLNLLKVEIDPTKRMVDIDRRNNVLELKW